MNLNDLKHLAEEFRAVSNDPEAVASLANSVIEAQPGDLEAVDLCKQMLAKGNGCAIRDIADQVKAKATPPAKPRPSGVPNTLPLMPGEPPVRPGDPAPPAPPVKKDLSVSPFDPKPAPEHEEPKPPMPPEK